MILTELLFGVYDCARDAFAVETERSLKASTICANGCCDLCACGSHRSSASVCWPHKSACTCCLICHSFRERRWPSATTIHCCGST